MGQQQLQISLQGYYNVMKPEVDGDELLGDWNVRTEVIFLVPKRRSSQTIVQPSVIPSEA